VNIGKKWVVLLLILLNVLAVATLVPNLSQKDTSYEDTLNEARKLKKKNLCVRAIGTYNEILSIEDTLPVRLEMVEVYVNGLENGEYQSLYTIKDFMFQTIEKYPAIENPYEIAGEFFYENQLIEDYIIVLKQAKKLGVHSKKLEELTDRIRYQYRSGQSMYTDVYQSETGYFTYAGSTYGFLKPNMSSAIGHNYKFAAPFSGGYAFVKTDELTLLISENGTRQAYFDNKIKSSSGVGNGLLACLVGEKYKYYNLEGEYAFGDYLFAGRFRNNIAAVEDEAGWHLINSNQTLLSNEIYEDVKLNKLDDCTANGIVFVKKANEYHMLDLNLKPINNFKCDDVDPFVTDEWAAFSSKGKWGFVDKTGKVQIEAQYDCAKSFSNGFAGVKKGDKWVFINSEKKTVIDEGFDDVDYFNSRGYCFVKRDEYWSNIALYYTEN
jgi:hypothetical protein